MAKRKNEVLLMLAIVFAIMCGIFIAYGVSEPIVYEKETTSAVETTQPETSTTEAQTATQTTTQTSEVATEDTSTQAVVQDSTQASFPVNLNTATAEQLMTIPKIGSARANAIIEYREHLGGYTSVAQIMEIRGIGETLYSEVAGYMTV